MRERRQSFAGGRRNPDEAESFLSVLAGILKVLEQQRLLILDRL
jgi:hypothetical protein